MAKAVVFTITYSLKIKLDLKQFQKATIKTKKLVSRSPWIASYVARSGHGMTVITLIYYHNGHREGTLLKNYRNLCFIQYSHRLLVMIS